jgi:hypothetical protein
MGCKTHQSGKLIMTPLRQNRLRVRGRPTFARSAARSLVSATTVIAACGFAEAQSVNLIQDVNARGEKLAIFSPSPQARQIGSPASNVAQLGHFNTFLKVLIPPGGVYQGVKQLTGAPYSGS